MRRFAQESAGSSGEELVETWRKSSRSLTHGNCVEVGRLAGKLVGVRDSTRSGSVVLRFSPAEWGAFVDGIRNGESRESGHGTGC